MLWRCIVHCYPVGMRIQNGGSYILAVDGGRESILSVWQWQWGHLLGKVAVSFVRGVKPTIWPAANVG